MEHIQTIFTKHKLRNIAGSLRTPFREHFEMFAKQVCCVEALRHSDWAVTMPLLVLKLYALINNPEHDLILQSVDASALCATIMVLLGAWVRLGLDEMAPKDELASRQDLKWADVITGTVAYLVSFALLILLLIDLSLIHI